MYGSLPERPDIGQLRRQAKELRDAARRGDAEALRRFTRHPSPNAVSLAAAQLVIARELGFGSWPALKTAIDAESASRQAVSAFVAASIEGRLRQASDIFSADPGIADRSLLAAAVLGEAAAARDVIAADPAAAVTIDSERGWPPLLYACYSRWHHIDAGRAAGLAAVVRVLLESGASPNTNDGGRLRFRSALKGSVEVNNADITGVLLEAGANPDLGQPIGEAVGQRDSRCLRLLLAHGARVAGTWAVGAAIHHDNAAAMSLLLSALEAAGAGAADTATEALPEAVASASLPVVAALLDVGADPNAIDEDRMPALRLAVRAGKDDTAALLRKFGAADDGTDIDRFTGACLNGDREAAASILAGHPDLLDRLTDQDRAVIVDAAAERSAETIALMLHLGFSPHARSDGEQPLHAAAYHGNAAVVRVLLDAGAYVDARDDHFDGTPLAFATVGSGEQAGKPGDWQETVRLLVDAGASRQDAWISAKPPSEEVIDLLRRYGISPDEPAQEQPGEETAIPGSVDTGVMGDIAQHLETAYRDLDLDLLASLLHPQVNWTGVCTNNVEVLNWYRALLADGTRAEVGSVEVDGDAVVLGLSVTSQAEGARPAPPQRLYQVFTVSNAKIVDIRGYPDRRSALTRVPRGG
ncbi:MAG TPA: ankyrin repeat domain-containing protein [Streptosporangiaceae bacterium]|nr:ankyrin repeat domain-containing protein [Streptosporangiaceae bacterium]